MWLAASPLYLELYMGQVSLWAASAVYWCMYATRRGRPWGEGLAWTGAVLLKPNALILTPVFVRLRRLRTLGAVAVAVAVTSLPYFLLRPGSWAAFLRLNLEGSGIPGSLAHAGNLGLWAALASASAKLAGLPLATLSGLADLPGWGRAFVLAGAAAVLAVSLLATVRTSRPDPVALTALWLTTYLLAYRDVWEHHFVFLLPAIVGLYLNRPSAAWLWPYALVALPTPFYLMDVSPGSYGNIDPERTWGLLGSLAYRAPKLLGTIGLWVVLLRRLGASGSPRPEP
jgi:hypothetical protein